MGIDMSVSCVECMDGDNESSHSFDSLENTSPIPKSPSTLITGSHQASHPSPNSIKKAKKLEDEQEAVSKEKITNSPNEKKLETKKMLIDQNIDNAELITNEDGIEKEKLSSANDETNAPSLSSTLDQERNTTTPKIESKENLADSQESQEQETSRRSIEENRSPEGWGEFQSVELTNSEPIHEDTTLENHEIATNCHQNLQQDLEDKSHEICIEVIQDIVTRVLEEAADSDSLPPPSTPLVDISSQLQQDEDPVNQFNDVVPMNSPVDQNSSPNSQSPSPLQPEKKALTQSSSQTDKSAALESFFSPSLLSLSHDSNDCITPLPFSPDTSLRDCDDMSVISNHSNLSRSTNRSSSSSSHSKKMILCEKCHQTLSRHSFSSLQLKKKIHRVCKMCTNGDVYVL